MRVVIMLALLLSVPGFGLSATIHVPDDYITIQTAIDASANGDTIIVRPGTYVENIDFIGKAITLKSEQGAALTIIDGNQAGTVATFQSGEGVDSVLDGFTITNGSGTLVGFKTLGGGIYCDSSSPVITNNLITANKVPLSYGQGGGMYSSLSNPIVTRCTFSENWADYGGGMHNYFSDSLVTHCTFHQNYVSARGGGMFNQTCEPSVISCVFTYNETDYRGAGICNDKSDFLLINCIFVGNLSTYGGGGMYSHLSDFTATNCTFKGNSALYYGAGMWNYGSSPIVTNCILWNDLSDEIYDTNNSYPTVSYSCIQGGYSGTGNIDTDPLFVDAVNDDIHLTWHSPCRNTGDNSVVTESFDFEGDPRIAGATVDMGADEYWHHLYMTGNPIPGGSVTFKVVGSPGKDPVSIYRGSLRSTPLSTQYGQLYIKKPFPHIWNVGPVPADGIATTTKTIPSGVNPGAGFYFQALHGPVGDPDTKLTNLLEVIID